MKTIICIHNSLGTKDPPESTVRTPILNSKARLKNHLPEFGVSEGSGTYDSEAMVDASTVLVVYPPTVYTHV